METGGKVFVRAGPPRHAPDAPRVFNIKAFKQISFSVKGFRLCFVLMNSQLDKLHLNL